MPDQPTKEQREQMREWAIERLGLLYCGLVQTPESPGYWEVYYEDEIEPLEWLLFLIESSPESSEKRGEHPLAKLAENMVDMTPEQHRAANACLKELIHGPAPSPAPSVEVCDYCGKGGTLIYADDGKLYHEFCIARIYEKAQGKE